MNKELNLPKDLSKDTVLIIARVYGVLGSIRNCKDCLDFGKYRYLMISETDKVIRQIQAENSKLLKLNTMTLNKISEFNDKLKSYDRLHQEVSKLRDECQTLGLDLDKNLKENSTLKEKYTKLNKMFDKTCGERMKHYNEIQQLKSKLKQIKNIINQT